MTNSTLDRLYVLLQVKQEYYEVLKENYLYLKTSQIQAFKELKAEIELIKKLIRIHLGRENAKVKTSKN